MIKSITINGQTISYELVRKKVKNINLRIKPDMTIHVSANDRVPIYAVEDMIRKNARYIFTALERYEKSGRINAGSMKFQSGDRITLWGRTYTVAVAQGEKQAFVRDDVFAISVKEPWNEEQRKAVVKEFFKAELSAKTKKYLEEVYPLLKEKGVPYPEIRYRFMTSRWGSCIPQKKKITLNLDMCRYPEAFAEYVIMHEMIHFLHANHGAGFYKELGEFMPDFKSRKMLVKDYK